MWSTYGWVWFKILDLHGFTWSLLLKFGISSYVPATTPGIGTWIDSHGGMKQNYGTLSKINCAPSACNSGTGLVWSQLTMCGLQRKEGNYGSFFQSFALRWFLGQLELAFWGLLLWKCHFPSKRSLDHSGTCSWGWIRSSPDRHTYALPLQRRTCHDSFNIRIYISQDYCMSVSSL